MSSAGPKLAKMKKLTGAASKHPRGSAPTQFLDIVNHGADAKRGLTVSIYDMSGHLGTFELEGDFPVGSERKYNIASIGKQITRLDLMFRGQDGIGRYLHTLEAGTRKYFATISCWWFTDPSGDSTVEVYFLSGSEAPLS